MKFNTILKIVIASLVILQIASATLKRYKSKSKAKTKGSDWASLKSYCYQYNINSNAGPMIWLKLNKKDILNGGSGIILEAYYSKETFSCPYVQRINNSSDSRARYFVPFFDMVSGTTQDKPWWAMRKFDIYMRNNVLYDLNINDGVFYDDISKDELEKIIPTVESNKQYFLNNCNYYKTQRQNARIKIDELTNLKAKNISTKEQLQAEIDSKTIKIADNQIKLKDMTSKADASKLQIRNYEVSINNKKNTELKPVTDDLQQQTNVLASLEIQIQNNKDKINGVIPVSQDNLNQSYTDLTNNLRMLQATYHQSDPKYNQIQNLLNDIYNKKNDIPNIISI